MARSRAYMAFQAMKAIGISSKVVKPVLKSLLQLYENNWNLIEEENYRVLADAIFESEDCKSMEDTQKEASVNVEPTPPRTRQRSLQEADHSSSVCNSGVMVGETLSKRPKLDDAISPQITRSQEETTFPSQEYDGERTEPLLTPMLVKGKIPEAVSPQISIRENSTEHLQPQMSPRGKGLIHERMPDKISFKEPKTEPGADLLQKEVPADCHSNALIKPKCEPFSDDLPQFEVPLAVIQPQFPCTPRDEDALEPIASQHIDSRAEGEDRETACQDGGNVELAIIPVASSTNVEIVSLTSGEQRQLSSGDVRPLHDVNDIAKGEEKVRISSVNEVRSEQYPPSFHYIPWNIVYKNANVNFLLSRIRDEDCCSDCFGDCLSSSIPCACARETGGEYAYTPDGLIKKAFLDECISMNRYPQKNHHFSCKDCPLERFRNEALHEQCKGHIVRKFIKECWSKCGCNKQCGNRVVQRGVMCNLQVFYTSEGKGWGLRTLEELPRGTFVCEYVGEVLTYKELYHRNMKSIGKHHFPVLLDANWGSGVLKDEEALCLDTKFYGNVARFINHRCFDANLVEIPIEVESPDRHYYHLALFTTRKIDAFEELTWDYGINFYNDGHQDKAFHCLCGSEFCRNMKRPTRAKQTALVLR